MLFSRAHFRPFSGLMMILVMERRKNEGVVVGSGEKFVIVTVAGFSRAGNRRRAVRFQLSGTQSWIESRMVSLRAGESLILGPEKEIVLYVLAVHKRGRILNARIAVPQLKRCFAHRLEVWEAIHGQARPRER